MPRYKRILSCLILLFTSHLVIAENVDIPYTEVTLDNGLRVVIHEDHKAPIVAVNVWYHVGSKNESPGKTGFAHLFEHLMFNGTENFKGEYFEPMGKVGATDMNGTTNIDRTNYFQNVPKTALDLTLWMESDRMGHLLGAIDQAGLDTQRGVVKNEKRQGENEPYGQVFEVIARNLYPEGHPYSWTTIGSMEDLNAASLDDVKAWFNTYYGPNNAVVVIAGDVKTAEVIEKVKLYFADIPPGPPITKPKSWVPLLDAEKRIAMEDRVPQARIYMVWPIPPLTDDDLNYLDLTSDFLGYGKNSRLYDRLVYRDQIATSTAAYIYPGEISSALIIQATAQPGIGLTKLEAAVNEEVQKFLTKGPNKKELQRVKSQYRSRFIRGIERIGGFGGKSDILAMNAVYDGRPDAYKHDLNLVAEASSKQIRKVASTWLSHPKLVLEVHPYPELQVATQGADRTSLPMPDSFPEVEFDKFERATLSNGMKLLFASRDAVPTIDFRLMLDAGFASDQFGLAGTSSMALSMLLEGTKKRSSKDISEEIALLGSSLAASSGLDNSVVLMNTLKENLDDSLDIYADVILNPTFPQHELERLKKMRIATIKREKVTPIPMALRVLPKLMYGKDHAYGQPLTGSGTEESTAEISSETLKRYHDTWFKPNHATMIIVGDTSLQEIVPKLEKHFADWQAGKTPDKVLAEVNTQTKEQVYLLDRPDSQQSFIISGLMVEAKKSGNELARNLMNTIYGGEFNARLNMNLREDKHWAYGAYAFFLNTAAQRPYVSWASVQTDKTAESMAEIRKELEAISSSQPPTQEELDRALRKLTLSLPGQWETASSVSGSLSEIVRFDLPDNYWNTYANDLRSLKLEDIQKTAKDLINPDNLIWVVVGDRAKIEDKIKALGYKDIKILDENGKEI